MTRAFRAHRFVLDLSSRQRDEVEQLARGRRDAYNFALALDRDTYAADPLPADWADYELDWTPPEWNDARRIETWPMNKVWAKAWPTLIPRHAAPGQPCQLAIADMRLAVIAAAKRKGGFPRFRSRYDSHQTVSFAQGIEVEGDAIKVPNTRTPLRVAGSTRRLRWFLAHAGGTIQKATLSRDGVHRPWRISIVVEIDIPDVIAPDDRPVVGLDLGITTFLTLSDGTVVENPRILRGMLRRLRRAQKSVSRSEQHRRAHEAELRAAGLVAAGERIDKSHRHIAKEQVVSRLYARVVALRTEFHHATANMLVSRYRALGIENLNIAGMGRNTHGKMSRQISDVGWASFLAILRYKADAAGVEIVEANRWFPSSQRCSACGAVNRAVKDLAVRRWACPACGVIWDRDRNAAINLCPDEARIQAARTTRLAEREKAAKKRAAQKARAAKGAATRLANGEAKRLAKIEAKDARAETRRANGEAKRLAKIEAKAARDASRRPENLAVTPTDSNARRGPVRPKPTTVVVGAESRAHARSARTETPSDREEARTEQLDRRQMTAGDVNLWALGTPGAIPSVSSG